MKEVLALAGLMALSITPKASFADHLEPRQHDIKPDGNLSHTNLRGRKFNGTNLSGANDLGDSVYVHATSSLVTKEAGTEIDIRAGQNAQINGKVVAFDTFSRILREPPNHT